MLRDHNIKIMLFAILFITGLAIIYFVIKNSKKNRVRKQMKIILISCLISFFLMAITDLVFPILGISFFPAGIMTISVGMSGMWYAINKHKITLISPEFVSKYIFQAVNEPIFILGEDFLVKDCNKASLNITGYNYEDLDQSSFSTIINCEKFNFNTVIQAGQVTNIEVDVHRKNKEALVCELSATVIYDEYNDILGIVILLHDVSERRNISEIQKKYACILEESNNTLKNEIKDRLLVEEQIRHFIYYDFLTEIPNRKKMLEDVNVLIENKNEKFAILFLDLDKFKSINDRYGHEAGDSILKTVAVRLKSIVRLTDTISRIGGDEFIIILRDLNSSVNAEEIAVDIVEALNAVFLYKGNQLFICKYIEILCC